MTLEEFVTSTSAKRRPAGLSLALAALWHERAGEWEQAHALIQDEAGGDCAWVHAYLHRREGDIANAAYWYRAAGKALCRLPFEREWEEISASLLESGSPTSPPEPERASRIATTAAR
jgi:hypothetical protein